MRSRAALACVAAALLAAPAAAPAAAQRADSARVGVAPSAGGDTLPSALRPPSVKPPITPTKALFQSLLIPGWGQASLDRGTAGAIFVGVEAFSVAMLVQSQNELRAAERMANDSVWSPGQGIYVLNPLQQVVGKRQAAVEDWKVLIIFNHILAAADAFVAAHLWNVPIEVQGSPANKQAVISTTLRW